MELDDCIMGRRSVRAYLPDQVSKVDLESILKAGVWAPSGMNAQPWRFVVIEDKELISFLSSETKKAVAESMPAMADAFRAEGDMIFYDAPALILLCVEKTDQNRDIRLLDSALAAQNMFLKAFDLGLGSCYIGWANFLNKHPLVLEKAGISPDLELVAAMIFGVPKAAPVKPAERKPQIVKWIK